MMIGICDPTSYGKGERIRVHRPQMRRCMRFLPGPKGASCLLYHESFAGTIELPAQAELGQIIRLHRMKVSKAALPFI